MSNQLTMAEIASIESLHRSGGSNREISRMLGVDRVTVKKFVRILRDQKSRAATIGPPELLAAAMAKGGCQSRPNSQTGSEDLERALWQNESKCDGDQPANRISHGH